MIVMMKDKLKDFWGNRLLQNYIVNTFCEIRFALLREGEQPKKYIAHHQVYQLHLKK